MVKSYVRWSGHFIRIGQHYDELLCGRRYEGRSKRPYADAMGTNLHWCKIKPKKLKECAADWSGWSAIVFRIFPKSGVKKKKKKVTAQSEQHHYATSTMATTTDFQCSQDSWLVFAEPSPDPSLNCKILRTRRTITNKRLIFFLPRLVMSLISTGAQYNIRH